MPWASFTVAIRRSLALRDRLWQMDLQLRVAEGRLSEVLGEATVEQDIFQRTLGLAEAAESAYQHLPPEVEQVAESYTNGINAYIESAADLPLEFQLLGYQPELFEPVDVLTSAKLQSQSQSVNFESELLRSQLLAQGLSLEQIQTIFPPYDGDITILQPEDVALIPGLASEEQATPSVIIDDVQQIQSALETITDHQELTENLFPAASNSWVVSGELTTTGQPFLANDPHLSLAIPSPWYPVHLSSPTFEAIGANLPGVPIVAIGHNNHIAWGETNSFADVQDLYALVETEDGLGYIYQGELVPYETRLETISVLGGEDLVIPVRESVYGPVISDALGLEQPLALRWVSLDETDGTLEAFLEVNRAQNYPEFTAALESYVAPSLNFVYADKEGNIGYFLSGNIPIRPPGHSGLLPVPGTGEFDWQGFIPFEQLPQIYNPERGYIVTANNRITPDEYPYPISFEWAEPYRAERITELILSEEQLSLEDMQAIQLDQVTLLYRDFKPILESIQPLLQSPEAIDWLDRLLQWDGNLSTDSQEATVFETWYNELAKLPAAAIGRDVLSGSLLEPIPRFLLNAFATGDPICGGSTEGCLATAAGIFTTVVANFGEEVPAWGEVHQAVFSHPVLEQLNLQIPFGGDNYTVNVGSYDPETFEQFRGASYRQIIDLSDPENSQYILAPGVSGEPTSPFYSNQLALWQQGEFLPLETDVFPAENQLIFGSLEDDAIELPSDALSNIIFSGAGEDLIDALATPSLLGEGGMDRLYGGSDGDEILGNTNDRGFGGEGDDILDASAGNGGNRLYGGVGNDELFFGTNDRGFGGVGDDTLDASAGNGGNRLYGGAGNDLLLAGTEDNLNGQEGDDLIFAGRGNSTLTGGEGADEFWLANAQLPTSANIITDFNLEEDLLGIGGLEEVSQFSDLTVIDRDSGAVIQVNDSDLAILAGIQAADLDENYFQFQSGEII